MLDSVHIKNLALIDEAEIDFGEGLNVLTGETGAGKSVVIGSISLALGEKVPKELLREGADSLVELIFSVDEETERALSELGFQPDMGQMILTRRIANGKSTARINSETVTASKLKEAASLLIDIHGQHEHQSLLSEKTHLTILDRYLGESFSEEKRSYQLCFEEYHRLQKELNELSIDEESRKRELALLQFEAGEIRSASLKEGEDTALEMEYRRLLNGKKIFEAMGNVVSFISDGEQNASETLGHAVSEIGKVAEFDEKVASISKELSEIDSLLSDAAHECARYLSDADFDDETFHVTEERLTEINRLKDKYGASISAVLCALKEKEERISTLSDLDEVRRKTKERLEEVKERLTKAADVISKARQEGGERLSEEITEALKGLHFLDVRFQTEVERKEAFTSEGMDEVRFLISLNPGEPLLPLSRVASGGELSRIMLALKTVLAKEDQIGTLIFDEIDAGISGRTAQAVSEKLLTISRHHQTILITHLPQIAAMADVHFLIEKTADGSGTISTIRRIDEEEGILELSRLLGGVRVTDAVVNNAREMRALALAKKQEVLR